MPDRYVTYLKLMFPADRAVSIKEVSERLEQLGWRSVLGTYDHELEWEAPPNGSEDALSCIIPNLDRVGEILRGGKIRYKVSTYRV